MTQSVDDQFLKAAIDEARKGLAEGGIPIGSVLVIDGQIVGQGHNRRARSPRTRMPVHQSPNFG